MLKKLHVSKYLIAVLISVLILLSIFVHSGSALAKTEKIAALVNNVPITTNEVKNRQKLIAKLSGDTNFSDENLEKFKDAAIQILIDELLISNEATKYGITATDENIDLFIANIENSQNYKPGTLKKKFNSPEGLKKEFLKHVKNQVVKVKFTHEVLVNSISIEPTEIEELAILYLGKDADLSLRKFTIDNVSDESYKTMYMTRKQARDCNKLPKIKNVHTKDLDTRISKLSNKMALKLAILRTNQFSEIFNNENNLEMYQLCSKVTEELSNQEYDNLSNLIAIKKLNFELNKNLELLRNKAYIKIISD